MLSQSLLECYLQYLHNGICARLSTKYYTNQNYLIFKMWTLIRVFREIYLRLTVQGTLGKWWYLKLVSKELNHFGAIAAFFQDWAPRQVTHKGRFMCPLSVSPVFNPGKTLQLSQSDLTPWTYRSLWGTPDGLNLHKLAYSIWVFENRCHREPHCQCKKCRQYFQPIGELTTKVRKRKEGYEKYRSEILDNSDCRKQMSPYLVCCNSNSCRKKKCHSIPLNIN